MHELKYINHQGQALDLLQGSIRCLNIDDLFNLQFDQIEKNGAITRFTNKVTSKTLTLDFVNVHSRNWKADVDNFVEVTTADMLENKKGRLYFDGYYLPCFINAFSLKNVNFTNIYCSADVKVVTDTPFWIKEIKSEYAPSFATVEGNTKRYAYHYTYQYKARTGVVTLNNEMNTPAKFKIVIYGACKNPSIIINDVNYCVYVTLNGNERLEIDSVSKTVIKYKNDGTSENCFNDRNKEMSIFTPIPSGINDVVFDSTFYFDIILYNERSIPKWL